MFSYIYHVLGIGIGYVLRNWTILQKTRKDDFSYNIPLYLYTWRIYRL